MIRIRLFAFVVLCAMAMSYGCTTATDPDDVAVDGNPVITTQEDISAVVAAMTLEEKVGQMVQTDIAAATPQDVRERLGIGAAQSGGEGEPRRL